MNLPIRRLSSALLALTMAGQLALPAAAQAPEGQPVSSDNLAIAEVFSDPTLQAWLLDGQNLGGIGADGVLTPEERRDVTALDVSGLGLSSLDGLGVFYNLDTLDCSQNSLTTLDLSGNPALTELVCSFNQLTQLDLSATPNLRYLTCKYNRLTQLDCSGLDQMIALNCEMNQLTQLDLSGCTALISLYCRNNALTQLNLQDNTALEFIETFSNYLTSIDVTHLSRLCFLHIDHNRLTQLDLRGLQNLEGGGFVAKNNRLEILYLPTQPGLTIYLDDFDEQDPVEGSDRAAWYLDPDFQTPVTGDLEAQGQILYSQRIPNRYTVSFAANGGSGSMSPLSTQWGEQITLPANTFVRSGYTFSHWSVQSNDQTYADQAQVSNLAGRNTDEDRVTLYAQWAPNPYRICFDSNQGNGTMACVDTYYGQTVSLPENQFTKDGLEFAGWSLTPGGAIRYLDQTQVQSLTAEYGGTVTLYAVWRLPLSEQQKPYLEALDAAFQDYGAAGDGSSRYTAQDWDALYAAYTQAVSGIQQASTQSDMARARDQGLAAMAQVPTLEARISQVTSGWRDTNRLVLSYLGTPALDASNAAEAARLAQAALDGLALDQLGLYCPLTQAADRTQVLEAALAQLQPDREALLPLEGAAQWLSALDELLTRAPEQVYEEALNDYQAALSAYEALDPQQKALLSPSVSQALSLRCALSAQKGSSAQDLRQAYAGLDLSAYSLTNQAALADALRQGLDAIRAAASVEAAQAAQSQAWDAITQIPTLDQEPVTPPDGGGTGGDIGGGTGGGSGGSTGGGSGGSTGGGSGGSTGGGSGGGTGGGAGGGSDTDSNEGTGEDTGGGTDNESGSTDIPHFSDVPADAWYQPAVAYVVQNGLMVGTGAEQFAPQANLSRAMIVQVLYNLEARPTSGSSAFPDVAHDQWYADAVAWAAECGLVSGYDDGTFGPNRPVTREQLAVILYRYTRYKEYDTAQSGNLSAYQDGTAVSPWASDALAWAVGQGVIAGKGGGVLDPLGTATRGEVAQMLMNYLTNLQN